jgi:replicative DNA helicase
MVSQPNPNHGAHMPRTLTQVLNEANEAVVRGDLPNYIPIPTGFDPLDAAIGGAGADDLIR